MPRKPKRPRNPCADIELPARATGACKVIDLRGTPCAEFLHEIAHYYAEGQKSGLGMGFHLTRGQSLYLTLGTYGVDPVLGPYTVTPDQTDYDFELRCDADPAIVASYQADWSSALARIGAQPLTEQ